MKPITASVLLGCALLSGACGPSDRDGVGGDDTGGGPDAGSGDPGTVQKCNKMDIVFVVDDSASMKEEQTNLATNFPMFATVLQNYVNDKGEHVDFRIAVTTTGKNFTTTISGSPLPPMVEHGPDGVFMNNCGVTGRWLDSATPNLSTALACRAAVGTGGASYEMPLLMTKHALGEHGSTENAGFIRPDALLGVVMLTDEDDVSSSQSSITVSLTNPMAANPVIDYQPADLIQFLDTLKGHRSRWAAGVIAGPTTCSSPGFGDATEAKRLKDFVNMTNANGSQQAVFSSICAGNLTMALTDVLAKFQSACGGIIL